MNEYSDVRTPTKCAIPINSDVQDSRIKIVPEYRGHLNRGCRDTYERRAPECRSPISKLGGCQTSVSSSGQFPSRMKVAVSVNSKLSMTGAGLRRYLLRKRSTCALRIC